jgi:hypothetical protein
LGDDASKKSGPGTVLIAFRNATHPPFSQAQIDRRILLMEVARLRELTRRLDLDLIDCQGRLQDLQERLPL